MTGCFITGLYGCLLTVLHNVQCTSVSADRRSLRGQKPAVIKLSNTLSTVTEQQQTNKGQTKKSGGIRRVDTRRVINVKTDSPAPLVKKGRKRPVPATILNENDSDSTISIIEMSD